MVNPSSQRRHLLTRQNFSPFGEKLISTGYVDQNQLWAARIESRRSGRSLIEILQGLTGQPLPPELLRQYKRQQLFELKILYGIDSLDLELSQITKDQIGELIQTLVPLDLCRRYQLVPLTLDRESDPATLLVAMVDPDNLGALNDLDRILQDENLTLQRRVIAVEDYQQLISKYLDQQAQQQERLKDKTPIESNLDNDLDEIAGLVDLHSDKLETDLGAALQDAETASIIGLVNNILAKALQSGVSDIHIEPQKDHLCIRFRKDGALQQAFDPLPRKIIPAVISRFKIIAELDIAERRLPQVGYIRRLFQGRKIDFLLNILPSQYGEIILLRILDNSSATLESEKLGSHYDLHHYMVNQKSLDKVVELDSADKEYLKAICKHTGKTEEEVLKSALSLYGLAVQAKLHQKKLGVVETDVPTITEVINF